MACGYNYLSSENVPDLQVFAVVPANRVSRFVSGASVKKKKPPPYLDMGAARRSIFLPQHYLHGWSRPSSNPLLRAPSSKSRNHHPSCHCKLTLRHPKGTCG